LGEHPAKRTGRWIVFPAARVSHTFQGESRFFLGMTNRFTVMAANVRKKDPLRIRSVTAGMGMIA
jgi:hypothetical protein